MTVDPRQPLRALYAAFAAGSAPSLADVAGDHEAAYAGPGWLRVSGAPTMAVLGMPGWWGKRFDAEGAGVNLLRGLKESVPMTATVGTATQDGKPAVIVTYPRSARWPLRRCRDELREVEPGVLLGLSYGVPLAPPGGAPFLLRRRGQ